MTDAIDSPPTNDLQQKAWCVQAIFGFALSLAGPVAICFAVLDPLGEEWSEEHRGLVASCMQFMMLATMIGGVLSLRGGSACARYKGKLRGITLAAIGASATFGTFVLLLNDFFHAFLERPVSADVLLLLMAAAVAAPAMWLLIPYWLAEPGERPPAGEDNTNGAPSPSRSWRSAQTIAFATPLILCAVAWWAWGSQWANGDWSLVLPLFTTACLACSLGGLVHGADKSKRRTVVFAALGMTIPWVWLGLAFFVAAAMMFDTVITRSAWSPIVLVPGIAIVGPFFQIVVPHWPSSSKAPDPPDPAE